MTDAERLAETRGLVRDLTTALENRNHDLEDLRAALEPLTTFELADCLGDCPDDWDGPCIHQAIRKALFLAAPAGAKEAKPHD